MKYKIIPIVIMFLFLVTTIAMAKDVDKIDWKNEKLTIKADGVYDKNDQKIKDKDKSEIWIDHKVKLNNGRDEYHIDSLVEDDTIVDIELYYDIQPDSIDYVSHTGKYVFTYTYNDWEWVEIECVEESCGGYVLLSNITLEYGTGSNTFTDAITGATWANDGVLITLTDVTDYNVSGDVFTIVDDNYKWSWINVSYDYTVVEDRNLPSVTILHLIEIFIAISFVALAWSYIRSKI